MTTRGMYVAERKRNPFIQSPTGGRALSALMLPRFMLRPPAGFGVLTMTGRKTGKRYLIFPRYHQLDAVRRLVDSARSEGVGHNYLVEHSAEVQTTSVGVFGGDIEAVPLD